MCGCTRTPAAPSGIDLDQVHVQKILLATNNYRQHEVYYEKGHNPWQSRWSGVIDCGALLASMVAKDCGAIP